MAVRAGCPACEQLLAAVMEMQKKIRETGTFNGREFAGRTEATGPPRFDLEEVRRAREAMPIEGLSVYEPPRVN